MDTDSVVIDEEMSELLDNQINVLFQKPGSAQTHEKVCDKEKNYRHFTERKEFKTLTQLAEPISMNLGH